jgi:MSHA biogenesis protein MshP
MKRTARPVHTQRGVALIAAIFLLVVLGGLAVYAVRIGVLQRQTVTASLRASQAFHAAKSGISWGAQRAVSSGACASGTLNLTEAGTSGFTVTVQCTQTVHTEGSATLNIYVIDALAEAGLYGGQDYVSRRLQVKVTDGA